MCFHTFHSQHKADFLYGVLLKNLISASAAKDHGIKTKKKRIFHVPSNRNVLNYNIDLCFSHNRIKRVEQTKLNQMVTSETLDLKIY